MSQPTPNTMSEPAFPRDHRHLGHNGMTLRDWFAGQAITICTKRGTDYADWAREAYAVADAILAQRANDHDRH